MNIDIYINYYYSLSLFCLYTLLPLLCLFSVSNYCPSLSRCLAPDPDDGAGDKDSRSRSDQLVTSRGRAT